MCVFILHRNNVIECLKCVRSFVVSRRYASVARPAARYADVRFRPGPGRRRGSSPPAAGRKCAGPGPVSRSESSRCFSPFELRILHETLSLVFILLHFPFVNICMEISALFFTRFRIMWSSDSKTFRFLSVRLFIIFLPFERISGFFYYAWSRGMETIGRKGQHI